jgi:hypothetical protein
MSEFGTDRKPEKVVGIERRLRGEITITHDYDFDIIKHLTNNLGFDVETVRVQIGLFDSELHIKIYENIKHDISPKNERIAH